MRYFLDTEFIEAGRRNPVTLISIGIVAEDGRSLYAVSSEFNPDDAGDWVKSNILPHLGTENRFAVNEIAEAIKDFCNPILHGKPEFWGYYADYDWVVFCQIFGAMIDLPKGWPMYCRDIKQLADSVGNPVLSKQSDIEHNALNDALWNKEAYEFLMKYRTPGARLIGKERIRQILSEGWTPEHDDEHNMAQLTLAGFTYASIAASQVRMGTSCVKERLPMYWPWSPEWWKPSDDPIRNLVKAGALIAAEIDRLQRAKEKA